MPNIVILVIYIIGVLLIFLNEIQTLREYFSLDETLRNVVVIKYDYEDSPWDKQHNGKLVHLSGPLRTGEPLTEPDYNIMVQAVKLKRNVAMLQWVEESVESKMNANDDGFFDQDRKYYYTQEWKDHLVESRNFYLWASHKNPTEFPLQSKVQVAERAYIGGYELGEQLKEKFNTFVHITSDTRPDIPGVRLHSGFYYHGVDVHEPQIGDLRIQFFFAGLESTSYSVVGLLQDGRIVPYETSRGASVLFLVSGTMTAENMIGQEHSFLRLKSNTFRSIGVGILFVGMPAAIDVVKWISKRPSVNALLGRPSRRMGARFLLSLSVALVLIGCVWCYHGIMMGFGVFVCAAAAFRFATKMQNYERRSD